VATNLKDVNRNERIGRWKVRKERKLTVKRRGKLDTVGNSVGTDDLGKISRDGRHDM
jgi:hypothetical protein